MNRKIPKPSRAAIDEAVDRLAEKNKLNAESVRAVLHRLDEIGWYTPDFPHKTALEEAFQYVEPVKALEIFESEENLYRLCESDLLYNYLLEDFTPFYSLEKLEFILIDFIKFFTRKENKEHLIRTGYPWWSFGKSAWLDRHINKLFYVKIPLLPSPTAMNKPRALTFIELMGESILLDTTEIAVGKDGNTYWHYAWAKESPIFKSPKSSDSRSRSSDWYFDNPGYFWEEEIPFVSSKKAVTPCDYDSAGSIPGLSDSIVKYIEGKDMRENLFDLKVET